MATEFKITGLAGTRHWTVSCKYYLQLSIGEETKKTKDASPEDSLTGWRDDIFL